MFAIRDPQPEVNEPPVVAGSRVYLYYEDGSYDCGFVCEMNARHVVVDFKDWKQRWPRLALSYEFRDGRLALIPSGQGTLVNSFRC